MWVWVSTIGCYRENEDLGEPVRKSHREDEDRSRPKLQIIFLLQNHDHKKGARKNLEA